jgi:hypothetical protein
VTAGQLIDAQRPAIVSTPAPPRLRPIRGLKRGRYDSDTEASSRHRLSVAFEDPAVTI